MSDNENINRNTISEFSSPILERWESIESQVGELDDRIIYKLKYEKCFLVNPKPEDSEFTPNVYQMTLGGLISHFYKKPPSGLNLSEIDLGEDIFDTIIKCDPTQRFSLINYILSMQEPYTNDPIARITRLSLPGVYKTFLEMEGLSRETLANFFNPTKPIGLGATDAQIRRDIGLLLQNPQNLPGWNIVRLISKYPEMNQEIMLEFQENWLDINYTYLAGKKHSELIAILNELINEPKYSIFFKKISVGDYLI